MTKKASQSDLKKAKIFLEIIHRDISNVLNQFDRVNPFLRAMIRRDLAEVLSKRVKEAFETGLEIGREGAGRHN